MLIFRTMVREWSVLQCCAVMVAAEAVDHSWSTQVPWTTSQTLYVYV